VVVKRNRHLNEPLKKLSIRSCSCSPDIFKNFVSEEVGAGVEKLKAFLATLW